MEVDNEASEEQATLNIGAEQPMEADPSSTESRPSTSAEGTSTTGQGKGKPTCVIVLGMAGSGKSTFVKSLTAHLYGKKTPPYTVNLDPAVFEVAFPANIDIRDTVDYKELMKQHNLGPNGAIVTALNLFTTRVDQMLDLIDKRKEEHELVLIDTPGQIEVFTWSASGTVLTESLASLYPTVILYVMDIARSVRPVTFMSNMLYACSILYRLKLPFVVVMNKADIVNPKFAQEWMADFTQFLEAVNEEEGYIGSFTRSMSLVLEEFYSGLKTVSYSALLSSGTEELLKAISEAREEYFNVYLPEYQRLRDDKAKAQLEKQREQLEKFRMDRVADKGPGSGDVQRRVVIGGADEENASEEEDEEEKKGLESFKRWLEAGKK